VRLGIVRAAAFSWKHSASQFIRAVVGSLGGKMGLDNIYLEKKIVKGTDD